MTSRILKSLSPAGNTIEIIKDSGIAGTVNMNPCRYPETALKNKTGIAVILANEECDEGEDDHLIIHIMRLHRR